MSRLTRFLDLLPRRRQRSRTQKSKKISHPLPIPASTPPAFPTARDPFEYHDTKPRVFVASAATTIVPIIAPITAPTSTVLAPSPPSPLPYSNPQTPTSPLPPTSENDADTEPLLPLPSSHLEGAWHSRARTAREKRLSAFGDKGGMGMRRSYLVVQNTGEDNEGEMAMGKRQRMSKRISVGLVAWEECGRVYGPAGGVGVIGTL